MKKATLSFLLFTSLLSSESLRSRYFYDSVLSCDDVQEKRLNLRAEIAKKQESRGYFLDHWIGMALFTSIDEYDVKILERRLKNLELLETEKCYLNFK
jgi:hypothetical protein